MLHVDVPSRFEIEALNRYRGEACVSIYLPTTPLSQHTDQNRLELKNLAKEAAAQLQELGVAGDRLAGFEELFDDLCADDDFWRLQANSLAVLARPDRIRTYRLANDLKPTLEVSDRFHLKPLLRAITFPHSALVLALSENAVRLVEMHADLPANTVNVPDLPKDAASAVGTTTLNSRSHSARIHGSEGKNVRLVQYARKVEAAMRPVLTGRETPLVLAALDRLQSSYRSVNTYPNLLKDRLLMSADEASDAELATAARPLLDAHYARQIEEFRTVFETRKGEGRATADMSDAARAATYGAIDTILVNMESVVPGKVDDATGALTFADVQGPTSYGIVDEIAGRALASGARVFSVRETDLPEGDQLSAVLRYPI